MKKIFLSLILLGWAAMPAKAAVMDSPSQVIIAPDNARLSVEAILPLLKENGADEVNIILPADAEDLVFDIPGHTIVEWRTENQRLDSSTEPMGHSGRKRAALLKEKSAVDGEARALKARISLWAPNFTGIMASSEDTARRDAKLEEIIPDLAKRLQDAQNRSEALKKDIAALPDTAELARKITVVLQPKPDSAENTAVVRCSYTLKNCGWKPIYRFDALPDAGNVRVSLIAEIWQYSGLDWSKSRITLVSQGGRQIAPAQLRPWNIYMHPHGAPVLLKPAPASGMYGEQAMDHAAEAAPPMAQLKMAPRQVEQTAFSSWDLGERNILEGELRLSLANDVWDSPLVWLGRPSVSNVAWLRVRHTLDSGKYWPDGEAVFAIDGHSVGSGRFDPKNGVADLFFGPDRRVTLDMKLDSRLGDKKGIIDRRKTLDWVWNISVNNSRGKDVRIRIEDPAPRPDDKSLTISYSGAPAPTLEKDHTLVWELSIPAGENVLITHEVNVSAPAEAEIRSVR